MNVQDNTNVVKADTGFFGFMKATVLIVAAALLFTAMSAEAGNRNKINLSDVLEANGFATLKFALDTTGLTPVLDSNRVTLFAPTNDVFDATAEALGCSDALDLATRLLNIPVGDSNALVAVLSHHAVLGKTRSNLSLVLSSPLHTANADSLTTGVNSSGLYVQGAANDAPSAITVDGISGRRFMIYPIDAILLPFAPPADLCS